MSDQEFKDMKASFEQLLLTREVAQMTRLPEATLRYLRHTGQGPRSFRMGAKRVVYALSDVEAWIAEQREKQTA